jgi:hypothetical protein
MAIWLGRSVTAGSNRRGNIFIDVGSGLYHKRSEVWGEKCVENDTEVNSTHE